MINFKKIIQPYISDFIEKIKYFVEIPSFYDEKTVNKEMPYGQKIEKILIAFAKLGKKLNFNVEKNKHYVELSIGKKGELIEIFGHLDTVPTTNNETPKLIIKNNTFFGRGIVDDKGPLLANLYAIKILNDYHLIKNKRIKIFAGGDEERGSSCLKYYIKNCQKEIPVYGFTPDSAFPLVYGEKGIGNIIIYKKIKLKNIININGGEAINVVMPKCTFKVKNINEIKKNKDKIKSKFKITGNEITFFGVAAHGANPKKGKNAFLIGLKELKKFNKNDNEYCFMNKIYHSFIDCYGKNMNVYFKGKFLKETTYNLGIVNFKKNILTLYIDFRFPETINPKKITKTILYKLNFNLKNEKYIDFLLHNLSSKLIKSLINAYQIETNDFKTKPLISGGGTYAKECPNIIAFGPSYPKSNYKIHKKNESIKKNELINLISIYMHAIFNLINL